MKVPDVVVWLVTVLVVIPILIVSLFLMGDEERLKAAQDKMETVAPKSEKKNESGGIPWVIHPANPMRINRMGGF